MTTTPAQYKELAIILVKPPSKVITSHIIKSRIEYDSLITKAKDSGTCLYYAATKLINKKLVAEQPWILDDRTIPTAIAAQDKSYESSIESEKPIEIDDTSKLSCLYCSAIFTSTAGRTLHIKSKHPEKLEEYKQWLKTQHGRK